MAMQLNEPDRKLELIPEDKYAILQRHAVRKAARFLGNGPDLTEFCEFLGLNDFLQEYREQQI